MSSGAVRLEGKLLSALLKPADLEKLAKVRVRLFDRRYTTVTGALHRRCFSHDRNRHFTVPVP